MVDSDFAALYIMRKLVLPSIILLIVVFFVVRGFWNNQLSPVSSEKSTIIFVVDKGEGFSKVTDNLKKAKLIKSSLAFMALGKQSGLDNKVLAGTFRLAPSYSARDILRALTSQPLDNWVTLIEGWRVEEMADKLNKELKIDKGEFLKIAKEGYMFPDTYLFPKDYSASQIVEKLQNTFDMKYSDDLKMKIKKLGLTEKEGVILASIVEREARSDKARTDVASILLKRLKIGMGLNADATVQYILGYQKDEKSWWKRHLTRTDLKTPSLYNTYLHSGLPPTPICNPSLASLIAVANADSSTPYLYYIHDSKGIPHYGKTLEEHNQNVANYP